MSTIGRDFILAGKATFTLVGKDSRFTYRVSRKDPEPGSHYTAPTYFVGLLSGPDNTADYRYLGILDPVTGYVRLTRNSRVSLDAPSVKAIQWALPKIWAGAAMPPSFQIHHEGACGRCGAPLTVPDSILAGFGPDCAGKVGVPYGTVKPAKVKMVVTIGPDSDKAGLTVTAVRVPCTNRLSALVAAMPDPDAAFLTTEL